MVNPTAQALLELPVLEPEQVAEVLQVSRTTAYRRMNTGELPAFRLGRCLRITGSALRAWLENPPTRVEQIPDGDLLARRPYNKRDRT